MQHRNMYYPPSSHSPGVVLSLLHFWYRIAAPPEAPAHAPLLAREIARRGRVTSLVMLVTIAMVLLTFIIQPSLDITITLIVVTCVDIVALTFNQRGRILVAGTIITTMTELGLLFSMVGMLQKHGGVTFEAIIFLPLLVQGIVVAVSTLPPFSVILLLVLNSIANAIVVYFLPYSAAVTTYLQKNEQIPPGQIFNISLTVYLIVGLVSFIWVRSANEAIRRADKADARAEYEQEMAQRDRSTNKKLTSDINEIASILAAIGNDPSREFRIDQQHNTLWPLARSLDNLRRRLINVNYELSAHQCLQKACGNLITSLDAAIIQRGPVVNWKQTKTMTDEIVYRINILQKQSQGDGRKKSAVTAANSALFHTEQGRTRLKKAALQLIAALNAVENFSWEPTGTALDEIAENLRLASHSTNSAQNTPGIHNVTGGEPPYLSGQKENFGNTPIPKSRWEISPTPPFQNNHIDFMLDK